MPMEAGQTATEQAPAAYSMDTKDGMVRDKGADRLHSPHTVTAYHATSQ